MCEKYLYGSEGGAGHDRPYPYPRHQKIVPFRKGADGVVARGVTFRNAFSNICVLATASVDGCALSGLRGLRPPSAALRWLRYFLLMPQPPLLTRRGMGPDRTIREFIHSF